MTTKSNEVAPAGEGRVVARSPRNAVDNLLAQCEERFASVLGRVSDVDWPAFALGVRSACLKSPALFQMVCDHTGTVIQALTKAAALGLSPHPDLEHFDLIPFNGKIDALVRCKGYLYLAMQSGKLDDAQAFVVYKDEAERLKANGKPLIDRATGEPNICPEDRMLDGAERTDKDIIGAISIVRVKGRSRPVVRAMTLAEILKRKLAGSGKQPAWSGWFPEMCQKTVLKANLKSGMVPLTRTMSAAMEEDDEDPVKQAVVVSPEVARITATADHKDEFTRRMDEPLPSIETICAELIEDIARAADMAGLADEGLAAIVAEVADVAMVDMEPEQLRAVLAKVTGEA